MWDSTCLRWARVLVVFSVIFGYLTSSVKGDGCHTAEYNATTELKLSENICEINKAFETSPPDYLTAKIIYKRGPKGTELSLMNISTGNFTSSYSKSAVKLFGRDNWLDKTLKQAFNGNSIFDTDMKRIMYVRKVLQSSLLGARMFHNLDEAYSYAKEGNNTAALVAWERALANHYGKDSECAIFANGEARGIDYQIMMKGVSKTNEQIAEAFGKGGRLLKIRKTRLPALRRSIEQIEHMFIIIYLQCVNKYGILLSKNKESEKAQAEGYAYYHAIAPLVAELDPTAHETILKSFNLTTAPTKKKGRAIVKLIPELIKGFEIDEEIFGTYDEEQEELYEHPDKKDLTCEAINPFDETSSKLPFRDR